MPTLEDYVEEIKPIFDNHILTNMGPVHQRFHDLLIAYLGVSELSLFVNGHMALETAIQAMNLNQEGGEVITTPFTFVSTAHAIARNGLKPIFCDIRENDYCIDPDKIEELITEKTVAIIPVHVYGNICEIEKIDKIAKKNNLKVIYDGAHAFGETYHGIGIGNFGDATMFSFHATKVFNCIEGGAVAFKDRDYEKQLHELKNFGIQDEETVNEIGGNAKLDEFRAAMGICNLRRIDECIKMRKKIYDRYFERLNSIDGIRLNSIQDEVRANYAYFPVLFNKSAFGKSRNDIYQDLKNNDIYSRKYFYPAINEMECYKKVVEKETPIAHDVSCNILTLPIYEGLDLEEIDRICDIILS